MISIQEAKQRIEEVKTYIASEVMMQEWQAFIDSPDPRLKKWYAKRERLLAKKSQLIEIT